MRQFFSKIDESQLLLVLFNELDATSDRLNLGPESSPIQIAIRRLSANLRVPAHYHIGAPRSDSNFTECWFVMSGRVQGRLFDTDQTELITFELVGGDFAVFFGGGHELQVDEEETAFVEFKTGPYNPLAANNKVAF